MWKNGIPGVLAALVLGLGAAGGAGAAETGITERTMRQVLVESAGVGSDLRDRIEAVGKMVAENETARAMREVEVLIAEFRKLMPVDGTVYVSVSSDEQFADFVSENRGRKVLRVAWGLQKLLFIKAFILAEEKPQEALPSLEELQKLAPYSSDARCERGYVQNLLGNYSAALTAYQEALTLAGKYASEKHNLPVALRGLGYSLSHLGKTDEARAAFQKSLEIEPESPVAHDGLAALEQKAAGTPPGAAPAARSGTDAPAPAGTPVVPPAKPAAKPAVTPLPAGAADNLPEL